MIKAAKQAISAILNNVDVTDVLETCFIGVEGLLN